jgi:integrase
MDDEYLSQLHSTVASYRNNTVCLNTRTTYLNYNVRFLQFMLKYKRDKLNSIFLSYVENDNGCIKNFLEEKIAEPILFSNITAHDFMTFLASLSQDGSGLSTSTYSLQRSAFLFLFSEYGQSMNEDLKNQLAYHFKGLKRLNANSGDGGCGKDPLSFSIYRFLTLEFLKQKQKKYTFARLFMILSWNLICRASNTFAIRFSHLDWVEDSLCVTFATMKNDQEGQKSGDVKHVYANPLKPEICPVLALGMYLLVYKTEKDQKDLFPGVAQYERFRKILHLTEAINSIEMEFKRSGIKIKDFGTHSMRKGAATYCSSGSTACPSSVAIYLRAGWTLGGVQDRYMKYEAAGDMFVGRTVAGLPVNSAGFGSPPPSFIIFDEFLNTTIANVFPNVPSNLKKVVEYSLASLVFHHKFIATNVPSNHPIFFSYLFQTTELIAQLSERLNTSYDDMVVTGVPPHISILTNIEKMNKKIDDNIKSHEANIKKIIQGVMDELEDRAISANTVTANGLKTNILRCLDEAGLLDIVKMLKNKGGLHETNDSDSNQIQYCNGRFHRYPLGFTIPKSIPASDMFILWCCGDKNKNYPPLRTLKPHELDSKNCRKRLSDLKYLMTIIENAASDDNINVSKITPAEAQTIYFKYQSNLNIKDRNGKRRIGQLSWMSTATFARKKEKFVGTRI